jgi:acyl-CoA thioester hydrolase
LFSKNERVYYEDTDAGGVVYHANYLNFMERCRCEWLDSLGFNVADIQQQTGIMFVVREAKLSYDLPARLFDELTVTANALQVGKVKLVVEQKIYNQRQLLCSATIKLATLHQSSFKLTAMPVALRDALENDAR